jgi:hypothetical protein
VPVIPKGRPVDRAAAAGALPTVTVEWTGLSRGRSGCAADNRAERTSVGRAGGSALATGGLLSIGTGHTVAGANASPGATTRVCVDDAGEGAANGTGVPASSRRPPPATHSNEAGLTDRLV